MGQIQSLEDALSVLRRRAILVIGIVLIGTALSMFYALSLPRTYESQGLIQIELPNVTETTATAGSTGSRAKYRLNLIKQQLMARDSLLGIARELHIFPDPEPGEVEMITAMRQAIAINPIIDPQDAWRADAVPSGLQITVRLGDPEMAAATANLFLERILEQAGARRAEQADAALAFFTREEARVGAKIAQLEADIANFKTANALSLPEGMSALRDQLGTLQQSELELEREIIALKNGATRVREEVLAQQIADLEVQKGLVSARIGEIESAILAAPRVERDLNRLNRELDQLKEQFTIITRGKAEAEMGQALEASQQAERFEVLEYAPVPTYPVAPSRKKITVAGGALALIVGLVTALLLEAMNPAIRTAAQLERELGVVPIVSIPRVGGVRQMTKGRLIAIAGVIAAALALLAPIIRRASETILQRVTTTLFSLGARTRRPATVPATSRLRKQPARRQWRIGAR